MTIEIINTGSELLLGRILNTNQQWLCRQLADLGYLVSRQVTVPDVGDAIAQAVRESMSRADLVITTGGLGPTSDDVTRNAIAELAGKKLIEDPAALTSIKQFFALRNRPTPQRSLGEALVPEGAIVLPNRHGTAPGFAISIDSPLARRTGCWVMILPGPPRELHPMFVDSVVPLLKRVMPQETPFVVRTLLTLGIGESNTQERIEMPLQPLVDRGLVVGYCASPGRVDVRLSMRGDDAPQIVEEAEAISRRLLGALVYGENDDSIERVIVKSLTARRETLALAESCTGGCISDQLTNVPGASAVFRGGFVTYTNEMKQRFLGVRAETIARDGAVSEAVAREMADGARRVSESDYAISVTGIAGPDGGTPDKPVGTVFIGLASARETRVIQKFNPWDRLTFKEVTMRQALDELRLRLQS